MRILIFRHGDPNYEIDGLTDKGKVEAELLAKQIKSFGIEEPSFSARFCERFENEDERH